VLGSSLSPPPELDGDEVDGDEGDSEERDDDDVELGWLGVFGSSLSPPPELDGDGVFAFAAGELAGWLAVATLVAVCGVEGVLAGCTAAADCGNAAARGCTAGAGLGVADANEEVAVRGDSAAVRACGTGAGLVGVGVSEVGKVGVGIAFGRQVSTAGLPDEVGTVAPGLGGDGIKGLGAGGYNMLMVTPGPKTASPAPRAAAAPGSTTGGEGAGGLGSDGYTTVTVSPGP
jgi:hypothetical protein